PSSRRGYSNLLFYLPPWPPSYGRRNCEQALPASASPTQAAGLSVPASSPLLYPGHQFSSGFHTFPSEASGLLPPAILRTAPESQSAQNEVNGIPHPSSGDPQVRQNKHHRQMSRPALLLQRPHPDRSGDISPASGTAPPASCRNGRQYIYNSGSFQDHRPSAGTAR